MEHNQFPRNLFSSGQTKQSIGMYTLNYRHCCDLAGSVLYYPQQPLVSSKYVDLINKNTAPYGINAIVAVFVIVDIIRKTVLSLIVVVLNGDYLDMCILEPIR